MRHDWEQLSIDSVVAAIGAEYPDQIDHETLHAMVEADFERYTANAKIIDFIPVFVERDVRERLARRRAGLDVSPCPAAATGGASPAARTTHGGGLPQEGRQYPFPPPELDVTLATVSPEGGS
jgi:hypothetical protein